MFTAERPRRGFTLIELMVVVTVVVILLGILVPAVSFAKRAARMAVCLSNQRQLGVACRAYAIDYRGLFPTRPGPSNSAGPTYAPWAPQVLYWPTGDADMRGLWTGYVTGYGQPVPNNPGLKSSAPVFYCPANNDPSLFNNYANAWGAKNAMYPSGNYYLMGYAYFGAYHLYYKDANHTVNTTNWVASTPPVFSISGAPNIPLFGDVTESYLVSGAPYGWFYAAHTSGDGVQWMPSTSKLVPLGMNCVLSDGSARWFSYIESSPGVPAPSSQCEFSIRYSNPGFLWGKPGM